MARSFKELNFFRSSILGISMGNPLKEPTNIQPHYVFSDPQTKQVFQLFEGSSKTLTKTKLEQNKYSSLVWTQLFPASLSMTQLPAEKSFDCCGVHKPWGKQQLQEERRAAKLLSLSFFFFVLSNVAHPLNTRDLPPSVQINLLTSSSDFCL